MAGVPLVMLSLSALSFALLVGYSIVQSMRPAYVFKEAFGMTPPRDVSNLKSRSWSFADSRVIYLRFDCAQAVFERLRSNEFVPIAPNTLSDLIGRQFSQAPDWWIPFQNSDDVIAFERQSKGRIHHFSDEQELLVFNKAINSAFYGFSGID